MSGGAGDDTYFVDLATDKVVELAGEGYDTIRTSLLNLSIATLTNVEALAYTGAGHFTGTGNSGVNALEGRERQRHAGRRGRQRHADRQ
jgi:Ca2+-binding RTX toxin-like protein